MKNTEKHLQEARRIAESAAEVAYDYFAVAVS